MDFAAASNSPPAGSSSPQRRRQATWSWLLQNGVVRIIARRLLFSIPLLFIVSALSFLLVALTPGDAARAILGLDNTEQAYQQLRHALGLDRPIYDQYSHWLANAVHGDLGLSLVSQQRVTQVIDARLPVTLSLIGGAFVVTLFLGVGLGVLSAVRGGVVGRVVDALSLIGFALPSFWSGAILIGVFAVSLRWLPATGYVSLAQSPSRWLLALILPVIALALHSVAVVAKQTREAMMDTLSSEYIRMAWATGISRRSIVLRHGLRNASVRVVTVLGVQIVGLLGGTIFVEYIFALPGLGGLAVSSATQHDLPVIQGVVLYFTVIVILVNLAIDVVYAWLDPRARVE